MKIIARNTNFSCVVVEMHNQLGVIVPQHLQIMLLKMGIVQDMTLISNITVALIKKGTTKANLHQKLETFIPIWEEPTLRITTPISWREIENPIDRKYCTINTGKFYIRTKNNMGNKLFGFLWRKNKTINIDIEYKPVYYMEEKKLNVIYVAKRIKPRCAYKVHHKHGCMLSYTHEDRRLSLDLPFNVTEEVEEVTCKLCRRIIKKHGLQSRSRYNKIPTFKTNKFVDGTQEFKCPVCGQTNVHGKGKGHRVSHCVCWEKGYEVE